MERQRTTMAVIACVLVTDYDGDIRSKWLQICTVNFLALEKVFTLAQ